MGHLRIVLTDTLVLLIVAPVSGVMPCRDVRCRSDHLPRADLWVRPDARGGQEREPPGAFGFVGSG